MPTCRDIITRALQLSAVVALGKTPKAAEAEFGLEALQSLYDSWVSGGMFGQLKDCLANNDYDATERSRVRHPAGVTITLPLDYDDGERGPYDLSVIETYNTTTNERAVWLWDRGEWVDIVSLALDDEAPLAHRGMFGLAACLALMIGDTFGAQPNVATARLSASFLSSLSLKNGTTQAPRETSYF